MANLTSVVESGVYSGYRVSKPKGGPWVQRVERDLERMMGVKHAILCTSASTGLYLALRAAGIGFGDRVLVPANTMSATAAAVCLAGATPIFVDVSADTGLATFESCLEAGAALTEEYGHGPDAIILVHIHGQANCVSAYRTAFGHIPIIEDTAQAFGSREPLSGRACGTIGTAGVLSFKQGKVVGCGEGGAVLTNDDKVYIELLSLRNHGEVHSTEHFGFNFHMTELQAAVLAAELPGLAAKQHRRYVNAQELTKRLISAKNFIPQVVTNPPFIYYIQSEDFQRPAPAGFTRGYHKPLCCLPYFKSQVRQECCLSAHIFSSTMLWTLPPETPGQVDTIVRNILEVDRV